MTHHYFWDALFIGTSLLWALDAFEAAMHGRHWSAIGQAIVAVYFFGIFCLPWPA